MKKIMYKRNGKVGLPNLGEYVGGVAVKVSDDVAARLLNTGVFEIVAEKTAGEKPKKSKRKVR